VSTPQSQSMLDALRSDHRAIAADFDDPAHAAHDDEGLIKREQLVIDLVGHFVAEEQYLYPAVREHLVDGPARADAGFGADRALERQLKELEDDDLTPERLEAVWHSIGAEFAAHALRQEELFGALAAVCSPEQLAELGDGIAGAEQLAPTRPRTFAVESAGANKVISFVEGFVDRARDYYGKRGVEPDDAS
jgi:hypothetical protein